MKIYFSVPDVGKDVHRALSNTEPFKGFDDGLGLGSPVEGDRWIVNGTPTGVFSTASVNDVAEYINGAWDFRTPTDGMFAYHLVENSYYSFDAEASSWESSAGSVLAKTETLVISGTTLELSYTPLGDLGVVQIGTMVGTDLKVENIEIITGTTGSTITLPAGYDGMYALVTYSYNGNA